MAANNSFTCVDDFERYAFNNLPKNALDYYRSGADQQITLNENRNAFSRYLIRPHCLRDVTSVETSAHVLGHKISFPFCIAPSAMNRMAHSDGEVAVAKAACSMSIGTTLSTIATSSLEEVSAACPPSSVLFFQLYIYKDRSITRQLVKRAEAAGFRGLILTIDTPLFGKRRADVRNKFKLPAHLKLKNFTGLDFASKGMNTAKKGSGLNEYAASLFDPSLTWKDVAWLKTITKLPLIVKGVLRGCDAELAVQHGVDAILVSNHGARQLDTTPATIDVLPEVVRKVAGRCPVYLDGGVRTGTDILKAVALGADAVFIGRPAIYGLAYDGEAGVKQVIEILREEFRTAMSLAGCRSLKEVREPGLVVHQSYYRNAKL